MPIENGKCGRKPKTHWTHQLEDVLRKPFDMNLFRRLITALFIDPEPIDRELYASVQMRSPRTGGGSNSALPGMGVHDAWLDSCRLVSRFTAGNGDSIALLAIRVQNRADLYGLSDGLQRSFLSEFLAAHRWRSAIAAFYLNGEPNWNLSFIRTAEELDTMGIRLQHTPVRRHSFMAGPGISCYAARRLLYPLFRNKSGNPAPEELGQAFHPDTFRDLAMKEFHRHRQEEHALEQMVVRFGFTIRENNSFDSVSALDASMLGDVFESLLDGQYKKRRGTFYTPDEVVGHMCRESLVCWLANKTGCPEKALRALIRCGEWIAGEDCEDPDAGLPDSPKMPSAVLAHLREIDEALEQVRVLDPAAGSGAFTVGMLREIVKTRKVITEYLIRLLPCGDRSGRRLLRENRHPFRLTYSAIRNNLFHAELDESAIRLAGLRLWLCLVAAYEKGAGLPPLPPVSDTGGNLLCGNSLTGEWLHLGKTCEHILPHCFDMIIGNPPYISAVEGSRKDKALRETLKVNYPQLHGAFDLYAAFLLNGIQRTTEDGVYSWIIPNKLLVSQYASPVLDFLVRNGLHTAISLSQLDLFSKAGVYPIIVMGSRKAAGAGEDTGAPRFTKYYADNISDLLNGRLRREKTSENKAVGCKTFLEQGVRFASGTAGFQAEKLAGCLTEVCEDGSIPFIVSGSVDPYTIDYQKVRYMGRTYKTAYVSRDCGVADSKWAMWRSPKIVIAGLTRGIEAVYCDRPLALGVGMYAIYDFAGFDPMFLLGIMNCKYLSYWMYARFGEKHLAGGYLTVNKANLEQMPLHDADEKTRLWVGSRAKAIQELQAGKRGQVCHNAEIVRRYMRQIDEAVYVLYGLKQDLIDTIEAFTPPL